MALPARKTRHARLGVGVAVVVCVVVWSMAVAAAAGVAGSGEQPKARLDPALVWILQQGSSVDLASLAGQFAVYSGNRPVVRPTVRPSDLQKLLLKPPGSEAVGLPDTPAQPADRLGVFVVTDNPQVLARVGAKAITVAGEVVTARLNIEQIRKLATQPEVRAIRLGRKVRPLLDRSVPEVGAQLLQTMQPFLLGKGVISGAVDTGIDHLHKDFRAPATPDDTEELASRILFIWDQMPDRGYFLPTPCQLQACVEKPPAGFGYGIEYTRADIEQDIRNRVTSPYDAAAVVKQVDDYGHGTHVAGIQASDGSSQPPGYPARYVGMAPASDIIMVRTALNDTEIVDAVAYIFKKADELGRPAVANLSLGGHYGPHDGTDPFDIAISNLATAPGRIVVVAAGNEGADRIHAGATVTEGAPGTLVTLTLPDADPVSPGFQPDPVGFAISLWYPQASRFTISIKSPSGSTYTADYGTVPTGLTPTADGCLLLYNGPSTLPQTVDNQVEIQVLGSDFGCPNAVATGQWTLSVAAQAGSPGGRWDAWIYYTETAAFDTPFADPNMTVGSPGTAKGVITVGAYVTRDRWQSINGRVVMPSNEPVGSYALFTSRGPTRDGRLKPDVSAPGSWIVATASRWSDLYYFADQLLVVPDREHMALQGTSMATPHVAGLVAQMLQAVPTLTTAEVRDLLLSTARSDVYTGVTPNVVWGYGKISADKAYAAEVGPREFAIRVGPNPARDVTTFYYSLDRDYPSATLLVYTIAGKRVYEQQVPSTAGAHYVNWNLTNDSGQPLATGLYVFVLKAGDRTATGKLLVAR